MAATSKVVSATLTATYFAAEPKPGQVSVLAKSLSMVLGMPTTVSGQSKISPPGRFLMQCPPNRCRRYKEKIRCCGREKSPLNGRMFYRCVSVAAVLCDKNRKRRRGYVARRVTGLENHAKFQSILLAKFQECRFWRRMRG